MQSLTFLIFILGVICFEFSDVGGNSIVGLKESREKTIKLLEARRFHIGGWRENTQKAVIAIHLATDTNFNENCEEKLMASQVETRVAITAKSNENDVLGDNIKALIAICADPVNFHGETLVSRIRDKTDVTKDDGLAFLALCIGGEILKDDDLEKITDILDGDDIRKKYYRAMALACVLNRQNPNNKEALEAKFKTTVRAFMQFQLLDGSFIGGVKDSAMYVQMLLASKQTKNRQWNYENSVKYLMREMEKSPDFDSILLTLPILNGKTMADIMCVSNEGAAGMRENESMKTIALRYEDMKIFSVTMKVKENITALQFIQLAAKQEPNLRFRSRQVEDEINVYEIAGIPDDLITGKYWQFYCVKSNENNVTDFIAEESDYAESKLEEGLDEFTMTDVKELILWYKELEVKNKENAM